MVGHSMRPWGICYMNLAPHKELEVMEEDQFQHIKLNMEVLPDVHPGAMVLS